jgi:DNA processing protein
MVDEVRQLAPDEFPPLLTEITDPPKTLFVRGILPITDRKLLCVVGSRKYSPYGKDVCEMLVRSLQGLPVTIVSGLAIGMDAIAHRAALSVGLPTIAVPGSGLEDTVLYPRTHIALAKEIVTSGGGLLSEFPQNFKATPYSFPQRNRIMVGMSHATLIIEAEEKSGTLITARLAMEYNRDVLTVPHNIFSRSGWGPHMLIKNGVTPVTSGEDLRDALGFTSSEKIVDTATLSSQEKEVYEILAHPMSRDELVEQLSLSVSEANVVLSAMELKGLITEQYGEIRTTQ